ncbi:MAG: hypothetical protein H0T84_13625 [Tatlockia sp.]|nr:hypothetical protein [Tatlockia sp.]
MKSRFELIRFGKEPSDPMKSVYESSVSTKSSENKYIKIPFNDDLPQKNKIMQHNLDTDTPLSTISLKISLDTLVINLKN